MHYRSIADMNEAILHNLHRLPQDLDLILGVPRSGLLAATMLGCSTGLPVRDLDGFLAHPGLAGRPKVLVLEDSISGGSAMQGAREKIAASGVEAEFLFAAVYGTRPQHDEADLVFEVVPQPRMFQWNVMHHKFLMHCCVDIDGILCHDPEESQNDDGAAYLEFLLAAKPLHRTRQRIGALVTSRLEKYRPETERWLAAQGIVYDRLVMLDLPSKAERQRLGAHGSFKARIYRESDAMLFIESEQRQAEAIARLSGKPVLCLPTHRLIMPDWRDLIVQVPQIRSFRHGREVLKQATRAVLGPERFDAVKARIRP